MTNVEEKNNTAGSVCHSGCAAECSNTDAQSSEGWTGGTSDEGSGEILFRAKSTIAGTADVRMFLKPIKPFSLNQVYLSIELVSILEGKENVVASTSVLLRPDTQNADLVSTINSYLNADLNIELYDRLHQKKLTPKEKEIIITHRKRLLEKRKENGEVVFILFSSIMFYTLL